MEKQERENTETLHFELIASLWRERERFSFVSREELHAEIAARHEIFPDDADVDFDDVVFDRKEAPEGPAGFLTEGQINTIRNYCCIERGHSEAELMDALRKIGYEAIERIPKAEFGRVWASLDQNLPRPERRPERPDDDDDIEEEDYNEPSLLQLANSGIDLALDTFAKTGPDREAFHRLTEHFEEPSSYWRYKVFRRGVIGYAPLENLTREEITEIANRLQREDEEAMREENALQKHARANGWKN